MPLIVNGIARYLNYRDLLHFSQTDPKIARLINHELQILAKAQEVGCKWYLASRHFQLGDQYYDAAGQTFYHYTLVPGSAFRRQWISGCNK